MAKRQTIEAKRRADADEQMSESVVEMEQNQEKAARLEQKNREKLISQIYQMVGRIEAAGMFEKVAVTATFVWLKQVKDSKIYRELPEFGSWENFCSSIGYSRRYVDEQIQNLEAFGERLLEVYRQFSIGYKDLRKLRKAASDGDLIIDGEFVVIGKEKIPMTPEHSEDLEAAVESLIGALDQKIMDQNLKLKAKDRVLEEKERVIQRQEKDLAKYKREVKARGFEPGEENFIRDMENLKTIIIGLELKMDSRNLPEDPTPLMTSAYIETLGHAARVFRAYYDTATDLFGDPDMDDDYEFPTRTD
jgi:hypothetical protein